MAAQPRKKSAGAALIARMERRGNRSGGTRRRYVEHNGAKGTRVRARLKGLAREDGFTIIELLVVVLIIGILAAIAIPSFLNQTTKATDASAKELAHSAQIAAESYATDNSGSYAGLTPGGLEQYDQTIQTSATSGNAYVKSVSKANTNGYTINVLSANGTDTFTIDRSGGQISRTCQPANVGGCVDGSW
jgi:type IV pilus assembly protein PilA